MSVFTTDAERTSIRDLTSQCDKGQLHPAALYVELRNLLGPVAVGALLPEVAARLSKPEARRELLEAHESVASAGSSRASLSFSSTGGGGVDSGERRWSAKGTSSSTSTTMSGAVSGQAQAPPSPAGAYDSMFPTLAQTAVGPMNVQARRHMLKSAMVKPSAAAAKPLDPSRTVAAVGDAKPIKPVRGAWRNGAPSRPGEVDGAADDDDDDDDDADDGAKSKSKRKNGSRGGAQKSRVDKDFARAVFG